jgi:addiction module HigA family antidote
MEIRDFVHKGLKKLYEEDSVRGIPAGTADKLRKMLAFLDGMGSPEELRGLPTWKAHMLTGDRKGTWKSAIDVPHRCCRAGDPRIEFRGLPLESEGKVMPMMNPPHPGDFIRTEIVEPAGLSVTAAATALGVSRPALSSLLNGKAGLSGEMALRIEKAFGVKMDTLMRMQSAYEIAQTRKREKLIRVRPFRRAA